MTANRERNNKGRYVEYDDRIPQSSRITVRLDPATRQTLGQYSRQHEVTLSEAVRTAIRTLLRSMNKPGYIVA